MSKNIFIIAYDWPPRNSIAVYRPYIWAKRWTELGANVTVLTSKKCAYDEPLDLNLPILSSVNVIEVPYRSSEVKYKSKTIGLKQKLIGFSKKYSLQIKKIINFNFDIRDLWAKKAAPVAIQYLKENKVDVVISTFGPRACHFIGHALKSANPEVKWVADYRDLWSIRHNLDLPPNLAKRERVRELTTMQSADLILTVSEPLSEQIAAFLKKPTITTYNGFDMDANTVRERLEKTASREKKLEPVKIVYTGMIYPGLRDPSFLFEAINKMMANKMLRAADIEVHFFGNKLEGMHNIVLQHQATDFVYVHGHVARDEALAHQASADLLLLLESGLPDAKGVLTGKIFEYMATGVPILSLGSTPDSSIANLLRRTKAGFLCGDNIDEIINIIQMTKDGNVALNFSPDIDEILKFDRSIQAENLFKFINTNLLNQ